MNYKEKFEQEVRDEVLSWSSDKIYNVFGHYLETIVMNRKWQLQKELKIIWKNRHKYHFRDSGEAFDDYVMCMYFGPKLINRYSNADMEAIINRLNVLRLGVCYFALQILQALDKFNRQNNSTKPLLVAGAVN